MSSLSLSWWRLVKTTNPPTRYARVCFWPFDITGPKALPSKHAHTTIFWTGVLQRSLWFIAPAENGTSLFLIPITFSHARHTSALSHKYLKPLTLGEMDLRFVLLSPHLAAFWINPVCCKPQLLSILSCCAWDKRSWFGARASANPKLQGKGKAGCCPHFTNGGTETCPRTHRVEVTESEFKPKSLWLQNL